MVLAGSKLGDGAVEMVLENGARVMVEAYQPTLHGELAEGQVATADDGLQVIRQGNEVVCIGTM